MAGEALLDTNIVIPFLVNVDDLKSRLAAAFDNAFLSTIVLGELMYGAINSARVDENLDRIEEFVTEFEILQLDAGTSLQYGKIKHALRKQGRMIPDNDIWLAASGLQYD